MNHNSLNGRSDCCGHVPYGAAVPGCACNCAARRRIVKERLAELKIPVDIVATVPCVTEYIPDYNQRDYLFSQ